MRVWMIASLASFLICAPACVGSYNTGSNPAASNGSKGSGSGSGSGGVSDGSDFSDYDDSSEVVDPVDTVDPAESVDPAAPATPADPGSTATPPLGGTPGGTAPANACEALALCCDQLPADAADACFDAITSVEDACATLLDQLLATDVCALP